MPLYTVDAWIGYYSGPSRQAYEVHNYGLLFDTPERLTDRRRALKLLADTVADCTTGLTAVNTWGVGRCFVTMTAGEPPNRPGWVHVTIHPADPCSSLQREGYAPVQIHFQEYPDGA